MFGCTALPYLRKSRSKVRVLARKCLERLAVYLDKFAPCFNRPVQQDVARRYVKGLLSDAKRKNMEQIWGRITDPGEYQSLQNFITHSTWSSDGLWKMLRKQQLDAEGVLLIDDTGIRKSGKHSVGVARQYSGTLGQVGNCQVIVTSVLRSGQSTWPIAMDLYLPDEWASDEERRASAGIPEDIPFRKKWEIALEQVDTALAAGLTLKFVVADAGYGDTSAFRDGLEERKLRYVVAIPGSLQVFPKRPRCKAPPQTGHGRPRSRLLLTENSSVPVDVKSLAMSLPSKRWKTVAWRKGSKGWLKAEFVAMRVTPSEGWKKRGLLRDECWLLLERPCDSDEPEKYYLSNCSSGMALKTLVNIAHSRWAIEQNYEQLKQEVAFDHFEGRSYNGLNHHLVLTALTFSFLERERRRSKSKEIPTLPEVRRAVTEIFVAMLFASNEHMSAMIVDFIHDPPNF